MRAMLGAPTVRCVRSTWPISTSWSHGNFGISYNYFPFKVTEVIGQAFWWTVVLVTVVQVLSFVIGILLGTFAAWRRNSKFDTVSHAGSTFIGTLQPFWIASAADLRSSATRWAGSRPRAATTQSTPGCNADFLYDAFSHAFLPALTLLISPRSAGSSACETR